MILAETPTEIPCLVSSCTPLTGIFMDLLYTCGFLEKNQSEWLRRLMERVAGNHRKFASHFAASAILVGAQFLYFFWEHSDRARYKSSKDPSSFDMFFLEFSSLIEGVSSISTCTVEIGGIGRVSMSIMVPTIRIPRWLRVPKPHWNCDPTGTTFSWSLWRTRLKGNSIAWEFGACFFFRKFIAWHSTKCRRRGIRCGPENFLWQVFVWPWEGADDDKCLRKKQVFFCHLWNPKIPPFSMENVWQKFHGRVAQRMARAQGW